MARGFFVTGTDTGVGKTLVACALMRALAAQGLRVAAMKPVAAGAEKIEGALVNDDVAALKAAANVPIPDDLMNPYCFEPPIAPHIAAAEAGVTIDLDRIANAFHRIAQHAECVVVEGAGGFRVPLGLEHDSADLARRLGLPVILVVGMRLGCLNHAILTADAVRAAGLPLAGWVANHIDRTMPYADENVATLTQRLRAPPIARIAFRDQPAPISISHEMDLRALQDADALKR